MQKIDNYVSFLAGFGIGAATSLLLAPQAGDETRSRIRDIGSGARDFLRERTEYLGDASRHVFEEGKSTWGKGQMERSKTMSDLKDKAKDKIDDDADAAKEATDQVVDKSKDVAHNLGKKMEDGGKRLQDV